MGGAGEGAGRKRLQRPFHKSLTNRAVGGRGAKEEGIKSLWYLFRKLMDYTENAPPTKSLSRQSTV